MPKGKPGKYPVTMTIDLVLTKAEHDMLTKLTGFGAQTAETTCTDILMRHLRHYTRQRRAELAGDESTPMPRPIPLDEDTEGNARA